MKKKMKKLMILGLAAMILMSGCGKAQELPAEEVPEDMMMETEEPEVIPEAEVPSFQVNVKTNVKNHTLEGCENTWMSLEYGDVTVDGEGYDNLKRAVENWSMERGEEFRSIYASLEERAREEAESGEEFYGYNVWQTVTIQREDSTVLSLKERSYYEDADPFRSKGINFDVVTGKRLVLADILSDEATFTDTAKKRMVEELKKEYGEDIREEYLELAENTWEEVVEDGWTLDATGIVLWLADYTEDDFYMYDTKVHLPYEDFRPYIKEMYLPGNGDAVMAFDVNQEIFVTLPESGKEVSFMLFREWHEDGMDADQFLQMGDNRKRLDDYVSIRDLYLVRSGQKLFCMVEVDVASSDFETTIYDLSDGWLRQIAEIGAAVDGGNINVHEVQMEFALYLLGTYNGVKTYQITDAGEVKTEDTEYILHRNEKVLTTTVDLPVILEDVESTLPAGSHIVVTATDGETYAKFYIQETGQTGVLNVERDPEEYYNLSVNGINEWECFEMLPYAG